MTAPPTNVHLIPGRRASLWITVVSASVFGLLVLGVWHLWRSDYARAWDMPVYAGYGERILAGEVPYRDVRIEYPPGALPAFVIPALDVLSGSDRTPRTWEPVDEVSSSAWRYAGWFAALMVVSGIVAIVATSGSLAALRRPLTDWIVAHAVLALSPLLLGGLLFTRYDLLPTALVAVSLALVLHGRERASGVALGVAIAAKLYPLALLPLLGAFVWRRRGRGIALRGAIAVAATLAVAFVPFALVGPSGLWESLRLQGARGLQAESTPASMLVAATRGAWKAGLLDDLPMKVDEGSVGSLVTAELQGPGVAAATVISTLLVALVVAGTWIQAARRTLSPDELVRYAAVVVVAILALGRVLSPQFLVWLLPLVPLVAARRGRLATGLLTLALVATHVWFPDVYRDFVNLLDAPSTALLLGRNALLVALLAVLVWPTRRARPVEP